MTNHKIKHQLNHFPPIGGILYHLYHQRLKPLGWRLDKKLPQYDGYNSGYLHHPKLKEEFHIRWWGGNELEIKDAYRNGSTVDWLKSHDGCLRFTLRLEKLAKKTKP
jgi:hypothetical protein